MDRIRFVQAFIVAAVFLALAAGCGNSGTASGDPVTEIAPEAVETAQHAAEEASAELVRMAEKDAMPVVKYSDEENRKAYNTLMYFIQKGEYYCFVNINENWDAALVTDQVGQDEEGNLIAMAARVYGFEKSGNILEYGSIMSEGMRYPIKFWGGEIYYSGDHQIGKFSLDGETGKIRIGGEAMELVTEESTSYYVRWEDGTEGQVEDDEYLRILRDEYQRATPLHFTQR